MLWVILIPLAAAAAAPLLHQLLRAHVAAFLSVIPIGLAAAIAMRLPLEPGATWTEALPWIPDLGIALAFRLDGLSVTFGLLISGMGALVLLYAGAYMRTDPRLGRLCGLLLLFLGAMLGVVFSDDVFVLFVFWELTSIASYLLIGFKHDKQEARDAARQALLVTGAGGLALLAGLVLLTIAASQTGVSAAEVSRISVLATVDLVQARALCAGLAADRARGLLEVGPDAPALLATECNDRTHAGIRLLALRHDGEGRHIPAGPDEPGVRR